MTSFGRLSGITIDRADPGRLAGFWSALLGGQVAEPLPGWRRVHPPEGSVLVMTDPEGHEFCIVQHH